MRSPLLRHIPLFTLLLLSSGCAVFRIDLRHPLLLSDHITSVEQEREIVSRAKLSWTDDKRIRVLFLRGNAYERGYQYGALLQDEIRDNMGALYEKALQKFKSKSLFEEAFERMRPFIKEEYMDEMHGLAHGARLPLPMVHHIHVLADMGEWGGKRQIGEVLKKMMAGELATTCSNIAAFGSATEDQQLYAVRILDWGLHTISKLHQYPIIVVEVPDKGIPSANIGWVGYLGAISGMNAQGITLGEMGYRNPPNETLHGEPMPFMLRDVMTYSSNLADVRKVIKDAVGTNSYVFMMTDGKSGEAELYVKDRDRFLTFKPGLDLNDGKEYVPAIKDISYGGRFNDKLTAQLSANYGQLTPETFMKIVPEVAMKSNFQNVIYEPKGLRFWVSNAKSKSIWAASQPYTYFDFGKALAEYQRESAGAKSALEKSK